MFKQSWQHEFGFPIRCNFIRIKICFANIFWGRFFPKATYRISFKHLSLENIKNNLECKFSNFSLNVSSLIKLRVDLTGKVPQECIKVLLLGNKLKQLITRKSLNTQKTRIFYTKIVLAKNEA